MKYKSLAMVLALFALSTSLIAQCNNELVEIAAAKGGNNAVYIREFKAKLKEGTIKKPTPTAKFTVLLNEGINYRFTVADAREFEGKATLQLLKKNTLVGSTNVDGVNIGKFDYACTETGFHKVLISFQEAKKGCAAGVLSMVLHDSTEVFDRRIFKSEMETLYIGMDNELSIAASGIPGGSLDVSIDNGSITEEDGKYIAKVKEVGTAQVVVTSKNKKGEIKETSTTEFVVRNKPLPYVSVGGSDGGIIDKEILLNAEKIELNFMNNYIPKTDQYAIMGFTVSKNIIGGQRASGPHFTTQQKNIIKGLKPGDNLFIKNVEIKKAEGKIETLPTIGFIIE